MITSTVCLLIGLGLYTLASPRLLPCLRCLAWYVLLTYTIVAFFLTCLHVLDVVVCASYKEHIVYLTGAYDEFQVQR